MKAMIMVILDRSGSMEGREGDVVGGVNAFIAEQKKLPDPASIAFVRFDGVAIERFRPMQALAEAQPLTLDEFQPRSSTPLLDAVGSTVVELDEDWKREQPDRCIVVIVTDGLENSSREYTKEKVRVLIDARQRSEKWAFIYLGANIDSFAEASALGIRTQNTANYRSTAQGTKAMMDSVSVSVGHMRSTGAVRAGNLGGDIEEDGSVTKVKKGPGERFVEQQQQSGKLREIGANWIPPIGQPSASAQTWTPPT